MLGGRPIEQWLQEYGGRHGHPVNRACHLIGIPLITVSIPLFGAAQFVHRLWPLATILFSTGWLFQLVGHSIEGKPPAFLVDWRSLFVGLYWWVAKIRETLAVRFHSHRQWDGDL